MSLKIWFQSGISRRVDTLGMLFFSISSWVRVLLSFQWFVTPMKNTWNWIQAPELRQLEESHLEVGKKWLPFRLQNDEAPPLKQQCLKWSSHSIHDSSRSAQRRSTLWSPAKSSAFNNCCHDCGSWAPCTISLTTLGHGYIQLRNMLSSWAERHVMISGF